MDNKHSFVWQVALLKETSLAQRLVRWTKYENKVGAGGQVRCWWW